MSERPDDRVPPTAPGEPVSAEDETQQEVDSEPRRRWQPNPELLRALAATQKDLRPGEASLFWDWTATRDSAPEAEDLRPSGEGEVLVYDKEAAAAYVPPKQVAPAVAPRAGTKSRIRVREDVDPRRQPTMKSTRDSSGSLPGVVPSGSFDRESAAPDSVTRPSLARERRRRLAWAVPVSVVSATIVFFWLHLPPAPSAGVTGPSEAETPRPPAASGAPARPAAPPPTTSAPSTATRTPRAEEPALDGGPGAAAPKPSGTVPAKGSAAPRGAKPTATDAPPRPEPTSSAPPSSDGSGFFIRKKGDSTQ